MNTTGSHISPYFTILSSDHQTPPTHPSCLRTTTEGLLTSTSSCLPTSEKLEGSHGLSGPDIHLPRAARQPLVWSLYVQNLSDIADYRQVFQPYDWTTFKNKGKYFLQVLQRNLLYLTTCRRCGQQYIGKTEQQLHCRTNSNQYNITHKRTKESPVAEHFNGEAHSQVDMSVMVINQLWNHDPCLRKIHVRESR